MSIDLQTASPVEFGRMDVAGFCAAIDRLKAETHASIGPADFAHLRRIERYGRVATVMGYATAWVIPNPLSAFLLSLGQFTRWLLAHHILHRGYDRVPGIPRRYTSQVFARGWRRYIDWFDWLLPDAWDYEHNILHHYHTGEDSDPDVAERHLEFLRRMRIPVFLKYALVAIVACTWKIIYYAPNSLGVLHPSGGRRPRQQSIAVLTVGSVLDFRRPAVRRLWLRCYAPYATWHFMVVPLLFLPLGPAAVLAVLINKLLAEAITNAHAFLVIGPNHTADDLYRFRFHYGGKLSLRRKGGVLRHLGAGLGQLPLRPRVRRLHEHLAQLPDRAPPLPRPADAAVLPDPAAGKGAVPQAQSSLPAGERVSSIRQDARRLRGEDQHASTGGLSRCLHEHFRQLTCPHE